MNPYNVLIRPLISEKSNSARENDGQYTFQIHLEASKKDVAKAVKLVFDANVRGVRTSLTRGKWRRRGVHLSKRPKLTKKAIVTLAKGETLKIFEDQ